MLRAVVLASLVSLFEIHDQVHTPSELKSLRAEIVESRDQLLAGCDKNESRLKDELESDREKLKQLNESSSHDSEATSGVRSQIHRRVAASTDALNDFQKCQVAVSSAFDFNLVKFRAARDWPERRREVLRTIEQGKARARRFGDIDDIGYRKFFDGQEDDVVIGEQAIAQMKAAGSLPEEFRNPEIQTYVQRLAEKLAADSDMKIPLRAVVVNSPQVHAIALPGGFLFVSSGLMHAAENESQLAGVLSHEIARIAARHAVRASKRSLVSNIFVQAASMATGFYGLQGLGGSLADRALSGPKGKYQEEADQLGIQYAWKAGFDPKGFIGFLDAASQQEPSQTASFFHTQQDLDERILDIFAEIEFLPKLSNPIVDSLEFQRIKNLGRQQGD